MELKTDEQLSSFVRLQYKNTGDSWEWIIQSESEEEVRGAMARGGEREKGQGKGPEIEPLLTLRLHTGARGPKAC